jgi:hypothetical protein
MLRHEVLHQYEEAYYVFLHKHGNIVPARIDNNVQDSKTIIHKFQKDI